MNNELPMNVTPAEYAKLPFPRKLVESLALVTWLVELSPPTLEQYLALLGSPLVTPVEANTLMAAESKEFRQWMRGQIDEYGTVKAASELMTGAYFLKFQEMKGTLFTVKDGLNAELHHTDIGLDIPASLFRLPYPAVYLHLGETGRGSPVLEREGGGYMRLDGAYLIEYAADEEIGKDKAPAAPRTIDIQFIAVPIENGIVDRSTAFSYGGVTLEITDEERSLAATLNDTAASTQERLSNLIARNKNLLSETDQASLLAGFDSGKDRIGAGLAHVAKILLYLNSREAVLQEYNERSKLFEKYDRVKGKKRAKLERQISRTSDTIIVGPRYEGDPFPAEGDDPGAVTRTVSIHVRRGHFRMQAHGPNRSQRKCLWIRPTVVKRNERPVPEAKEYIVQ